MKIALVAEWLDAWRGGAETSTLQFTHHLMDRGVEVHVFTRSRPSPAPGLHVHTISGASMSRTRRSITFTHRVENLLQSDSFEVVHAISPCRHADIYQPRGGTVAETIERNLALLKSRPARRLKRYANRLNFKQQYALAFERRLLGHADGPLVVAVSDYVVRQLQRHYGLSDERVRKVYNGVDPDGSTAQERARHRPAVRREFNIADRDCLVLLIAHNFRLKGVKCWMEALARLVKRGVSDVRSLVIGKGDSERWHRLAARLGITEYLTFTGPSTRVREFRCAADVVVHPTYYDPCSRVVLEAMVAGLPCVTTRWDGASEVLEDGTQGFVIDDPSDVSALADRVDRLRDADLRRQLGRAAAALADRLSMARHTAEMLSLYEEMSAPGGARRRAS
ncbi:MAG: glycosyltransferase family 4 protein [Phycisphaerales bacterium]|nr:MAG: glycosyltransferase family 4 protein [Phycisphaerales bacterium]